MRHHILLPTDFSDNAWSAAVYALKLYADFECTFYFLNTTSIKVSMLSNLSNKLLNVMKEAAMKELLDLKALAESGNANSNHDFEIILSTADLNKAIKHTVKKYSIHLIIMGTKGSTGAQEFFFGSNTVRVIKNTNCPVLVVPEEYDFIEPKQIAFPTDYNRFYDSKELTPLTQLADLYDSKIRIVHINIKEELNAVQEYNLSALKGYLSNYESSLHWMPKYAKKAVEINDFIEELGIDILAMLKYKHSFIQAIIKEPVIKNLGFHAKIPFLVIPE